MLDTQTIEGFVKALLIKKFDNATEIPQCHKEWWELCTTGGNFVAIAAPRGHAKSTAITFSYTLAAVLFRQSQFVIIVSDTETQASLFLGDIANELVENEDLISLFGVKRFLKQASTDIIVEMDDGHQFRIIAKGAEQKLRGLKWRNKRPDLIICDDLENDEIVLNQERRNKFKRWFTAALLPCRSINGRVIMIGTILHMDSLLENIMPIMSSKYTVDEELRVTTLKKSMWNAVKYRAHNSDFSKILWQKRFSKEYFQMLKKEWTEKGMPDIYSQEYLNYPIDETNAYFRRDDFEEFTVEDLETNLVFYSAVDFAISQRETADFTVIATVGVTPTGDLLVVDIRRGRMDSFEIVEEIFSVHKKYRPELFIAESGAIEKAIGPFLYREMSTRNSYPNIHPVTPTKDKLSRARSIQARMRAGGIRFDKDKSWYQSLEDEMARFPRDRHDDQVDALAWIGLTLDKIVDAPTQEELDEEEYNNMVAEDNLYEGRSAVTGY